VAHLEAVWASPGWAALAAWFAERPEHRVRELEATLAAAEAERDASKERLDTLVPPLPPEWEGPALRAGIKAAVDQAKEYRGRAKAAEARCARYETALRELANHGIRCDLNPTALMGEPMAVYDQWVSMIRWADARVRKVARAAFGDAGGGTGEGGEA
jgi:hypothetical protein